MSMSKILIFLRVVQVRKNKRGFKRYRLNPLNPLSYITIVISVIIGILMFGFVGIFEEMDFKTNPFKYH